MSVAGLQVRSDAHGLRQRLRASRQLSLTLAAPLSDEDQAIQAMDDASPTKWHLAHTTWFYEAFVLARQPNYKRFSDDFEFCFNSYYETVGARQPRGRRGLLSRPAASEVRAYRQHVDEALEGLMQRGEVTGSPLEPLIELGINHEQQHQELLLTDILSLFAANPLRPAYQKPHLRPVSNDTAADPAFVAFSGGVHDIGHDGNGFAYDNEGPRHKALVHPFRLASRCVTNSEWLAFIDDGGYRTATLWLADGWGVVAREGWAAPGYWEQRDGTWKRMTLAGLCELAPEAPVTHISFYEADAFARWCGKRLPSEFEWEVAAQGEPVAGNTLGTGEFEPRAPKPRPDGRPTQLFGDVWEWTQSGYLPYPGYRPAPGAVGEYNGKFMCNQYVLRGASCVTPDGHSRATYRNFFYPHQRWQFTGLRLAEDA